MCYTQKSTAAPALLLRNGDVMSAPTLSCQVIGKCSTRKNCVIQPDGIEYVLALRVDFPDQTGRRTANEIDNYLFATDDVSLKSYYTEVSYGQMDIQPGPMGGCMPRERWYHAKREMGYYGAEAHLVARYQLLVRELCEAVDSVVDFSKYDRDGDGYVDHLFVIHAGNDQASSHVVSDIWSILVTDVNGGYDGVKVDSAVMVAEEPSREKPRIGIWCHEFFHDFGAPDMYANSRYVGTIDQQWGLMGFRGAYQGDDDDGLKPSHICGYLKWDFDGIPENGRTGWIKPIVIEADIENLEVEAFETGTPENKLFKIDIPGKGGREFFLIENRNKHAGRYDTELPESGILIWHIDETKYRGYRDAANRLWLEDPIDPEHQNMENITANAAYSADDNQTAFAPCTFPNSNANDGSFSGISIVNIGREGLSMPISVFFGDTYEPNEGVHNAYGPIPYNSQYLSFISHQSDRDYYKFETAAHTPIAITLSGIPEGANYSLRLLSFNGRELSRAIAKNANEKYIAYKPTRSEILYILVESRNGYSSTDCYVLAVQRFSPSHNILRLTNVRVYPNPLRKGKTAQFEYTIAERQEASYLTLEIFSVSGELIYQSSESDVMGAKHFSWNGRNYHGNIVTGGVYLYVISIQNGKETAKAAGKIAVE